MIKLGGENGKMDKNKKTVVEAFQAEATKTLKSVSEGGSPSLTCKAFFVGGAEMSATYEDNPMITHSGLVKGVSAILARPIRNPQVHQWLMANLDNGFLIRKKGIGISGKPSFHYRISEESYKTIRANVKA